MRKDIVSEYTGRTSRRKCFMNPNFFITGLAKGATQKLSEDYEKSQRENIVAQLSR